VLNVTFLASAAIYVELAKLGICYELIPTRYSFERVKGQMTFQDQLSESRDWSITDIGIFHKVPSLEAVKPFWMA
jgi:hypothetical protein